LFYLQNVDYDSNIAQMTIPAPNEENQAEAVVATGLLELQNRNNEKGRAIMDTPQQQMLHTGNVNVQHLLNTLQQQTRNLINPTNQEQHQMSIALMDILLKAQQQQQHQVQITTTMRQHQVQERTQQQPQLPSELWVSQAPLTQQQPKLTLLPQQPITSPPQQPITTSPLQQPITTSPPQQPITSLLPQQSQKRQDQRPLHKAQQQRKELALQWQVDQLQESIKELQQDQLKEARNTIAEKLKPTSTLNKAKTTAKGNTSTKTPSPSSTSSSSENNATKKNASKKKQVGIDIPAYSDDDSSLNDGVDYTKEENYAVKKFIGHREIQKKKKGREIQLLTRWKGWRDKKSITMEPLDNMVQDWPNEVKRYCEKNQEINEICRRVHGNLFE